MANNNSGFFRVSKIVYCNGKYTRYSYQIKNELVFDEIRLKDIKKLKERVESKGYLWGIVEMKKAMQTANETGYSIEELQGRHGLKMKGDSK